MDHPAVDIRQAEVAALVTEGQFLVVDPHQVQDGGVQIMHMDGVLRDVVREVVRLAILETSLHTPAGHPHRPTAWVVVASVIFTGQSALAVHGASKLTAPNHQRVIQHAPTFQIGQQRVTRLVDVAA